MIDRKALLDDLQKLLPKLEADLLERSESAEVPDVGRTLREEYAAAQAAERTAQNFEDWRADAITQVAAAWVLCCVFVRFLEDNRLVDPPKSPGPASGSSGRGTSTSCTSAAPDAHRPRLPARGLRRAGEARRRRRRSSARTTRSATSRTGCAATRPGS